MYSIKYWFSSLCLNDVFLDIFDLYEALPALILYEFHVACTTCYEASLHTVRMATSHNCAFDIVVVRHRTHSTEQARWDRVRSYPVRNN